MSKSKATFRIPEGAFRPFGVERADGLPGAIDPEWLAVCDVPRIHKVTRGSGGRVALIGTYVEAFCPVFGDRLTSYSDVIGRESDQPDECDFGTFLASVAVGKEGENYPSGVAPEAELGVWRVTGGSLRSDQYALATAIGEAAMWGAESIILPFCSPDYSTVVSDEIKAATRIGCVVVVPATMDRASENPSYHPSTMGEVLTVGATLRDGKPVGWNPMPHEMTMGVPGACITGALPDGRVGTWSGTSVAAAYAAGLVCLVRCAEREGQLEPITPRELVEEIRNRCWQWGNVGDRMPAGAGVPKLAEWIEQLAAGEMVAREAGHKKRVIQVVDPDKVPEGYDGILYTRG